MAKVMEGFTCTRILNDLEGKIDSRQYASECISTPGKLEKHAWPQWESNLRPLEHQPNAPPNEPRGQVGSSM